MTSQKTERAEDTSKSRSIETMTKNKSTSPCHTMSKRLSFNSIMPNRQSHSMHHPNTHHQITALKSNTFNNLPHHHHSTRKQSGSFNSFAENSCITDGQLIPPCSKPSVLLHCSKLHQRRKPWNTPNNFSTTWQHRKK